MSCTPDCRKLIKHLAFSIYIANGARQRVSQNKPVDKSVPCTDWLTVTWRVMHFSRRGKRRVLYLNANFAWESLIQTEAFAAKYYTDRCVGTLTTS